jgi:hypothetical protein
MIDARPVAESPGPARAGLDGARLAGEVAGATLRRWPYPYEAALAICSDLDETPTADDYLDMMRLLNTTASTRLGTGVGLEVGNSIYFDMAPSQFSYWNGDERAREAVRALILSGHVDCLHSFGDLATTRSHAARALDELARHGCSMKVWIDHAVAPSNFGPDIMQGSGDVEGSPAYHADLTCAFGIEYVWRGRVTSVIGQDVARRLGGIAQWRHPAASSMTAAKEAAKGWLARAGSSKYASHLSNELLWSSRLRSGQPVREFLRANPSWAGISVYETADGLGEVVTDRFLDRLVSRGGGCVLYTHLGKMRQPGRTVAPSARQALERVAGLFSSGRLLVTTTRRLLDFCHARRSVSWTTRPAEDGGMSIDVTTPALGSRDLRALAGLTFHVSNPSRTRLTIDGRRDVAVRVNIPDLSGRASISLPWPRLSFPGV